MQFVVFYKIIFYIFFVESKVGGWVSGLRSPEDVELEVEEAEDISRGPHRGTPSTPSAMTKSQTKT